MSMPYLLLVGGLSKSINGGRGLTNQDISIQKTIVSSILVVGFSAPILTGSWHASPGPRLPTNRLLEACEEVTEKNGWSYSSMQHLGVPMALPSVRIQNDRRPLSPSKSSLPSDAQCSYLGAYFAFLSRGRAGLKQRVKTLPLPTFPDYWVYSAFAPCLNASKGTRADITSPRRLLAPHDKPPGDFYDIIG